MKGSKEIVLENEPRKMNPTLKRIVRDKYLYLMLLPAVAVMLIFKYLPMGGLLMAFEDYSPFKGIFGSKWVGFANFVKIFTQPKFTTAIRNTLVVSLLDLVIGFPAPILLALLINELENKVFKRIVQTVSYLPHFLSWISVVGIVSILFGRDGIVNDIRIALGAQERIVFLAKQEWFIWFLLGTMVWKETGWGTVIHLANLSSISPDLYEAANIDGANRLQLEKWVREDHPDALIVRLPALYGIHLKKNFLYDLHTITPAMLREEKYRELAARCELVEKGYSPAENGFYKLNGSVSGTALREWFEAQSFNALAFTDSRSRYQFYDLGRLWGDIEACLQNDLRLVNLTTPPVSAAKVYTALTGKTWKNELDRAPFDYDLRSLYAGQLGGQGGYLCSEKDELRDIRTFMEEWT